MGTQNSSTGWSKDNSSVSKDHLEIRTVTPTDEHKQAHQQNSSQQQGQSTQRQQQQQQGSGSHRQAQQGGSNESLEIEDEDLNEQGDEKLTGDERGGD